MRKAKLIRPLNRQLELSRSLIKKERLEEGSEKFCSFLSLFFDNQDKLSEYTQGDYLRKTENLIELFVRKNKSKEYKRKTQQVKILNDLSDTCYDIFRINIPSNYKPTKKNIKKYNALEKQKEESISLINQLDSKVQEYWQDLTPKIRKRFDNNVSDLMLKYANYDNPENMSVDELVNKLVDLNFRFQEEITSSEPYFQNLWTLLDQYADLLPAIDIKIKDPFRKKVFHNILDGNIMYMDLKYPPTLKSNSDE